MKGCVALNSEQVKAVTSLLSLRDKAWFMVATKTGLRISEVLSLTLENISQDLDWIKVSKKNTKGKIESKILPLHVEAQTALREWIMSMDTPLESSIFVSRKGGYTKPLDTRSAHKILHKALIEAGISGLPGQLGTHVMRKTFAKLMYQRLGYDLRKMQAALGHKNINSTIQYLGVHLEDVHRAMVA